MSSVSLPVSGVEVATFRTTAEVIPVRLAVAPRPAERFEAGRTIVWEGDPSRYAFQLTEGTVRLCWMLFDGGRIVADFVHPGELFGPSRAGRYIFNAEAVTDCRALRTSPDRVERSPAASSAECADPGRRISLQHAAMHERLLLLLHKNSDQRVADFILNTGRRLLSELRNGSSFTLAMPRTDIADHLGLTVETVCRAISRLRRENILGVGGNGAVVVTSLTALEQRAGETSNRQDGEISDRIRCIQRSPRALGANA